VVPCLIFSGATVLHRLVLADHDVIVGETGSRDVVQSFYAGFEHKDFARAILPLFSNDIKWHVAGQNPLAGDFHGPEEVFAAMRRYADTSNGTLHLHTLCILGAGTHAVAIHAASARRGQLQYSAHEIDVFHVAGGLITEMWSFSEDQDATDALWA
jgi:ketosteroid isomerase-like protein